MANYLRALGTVVDAGLVIRFPPKARHYRKEMELGCVCRAGLGDGAQVSTAASYAAMGAKVGSIVPGIGNVVGAVVGALYGAILGKKKPVRPSAEQISQCNQVLSEYEALMAQYPSVPLGAAMGEGNLKSVYVCFEMVRTGTTKDPRFLDGNWQLARDMAIEAVKKTFAAPAGTEVVLSTAGRRDIKGKAFRHVEVRWINTEANSLQSIGAKLQRFIEDVCLAYQKPGLCGRWGDDLFGRLAVDIVDWAAATYLPQVEIPKEPPSAPAASPVAPAAPPPPSVPVPAAAVPPNVAPPAVSAPTLPPNASPDQIQHAISQLTQMFMQTQQAQMMSASQAQAAAQAAAQQWLASQGLQAPPAAVAQTTQAAVSQASGNTSLYLGLAAAAAFMFAMPARSSARSRSRGPRRARSRR